MKRYAILLILLVLLAPAPLSAQQPGDGPPLLGGEGMKKYVEKPKDTRQSDQTLTVMILVFSGFAAILIAANFFGQTRIIGAVKRQRPWGME